MSRDVKLVHFIFPGSEELKQYVDSFGHADFRFFAWPVQHDVLSVVVPVYSLTNKIVSAGVSNSAWVCIWGEIEVSLSLNRASPLIHLAIVHALLVAMEGVDHGSLPIVISSVGLIEVVVDRSLTLEGLVLNCVIVEHLSSI